MREYELNVIVQPEISEEGSAAILGRLDAALEATSGRLCCDDLGKRKLAYEINRFQKGHYYLLSFLDDGQVVPELERMLRLDESVLRFLTVKVSDHVADIDARKQEAREREEEIQRRAAERAEREAEEARARAEAEKRQAEEALAAQTAHAESQEDAAAPSADEGAENSESSPEADSEATAAPESEPAVEQAAEEDSATDEKPAEAPADDSNEEEKS